MKIPTLTNINRSKPFDDIRYAQKVGGGPMLPFSGGLDKVQWELTRARKFFLYGSPGSGKTAYLDSLLFHFMRQAPKWGVKLHILYYAMERTTIDKKLKWLAKLHFEKNIHKLSECKERILYDVNYLKNLIRIANSDNVYNHVNAENPYSEEDIRKAKEESERLINSYEDELNDFLDNDYVTLDLRSGSYNPTGIYKDTRAVAEKYGTFKRVDKFTQEFEYDEEHRNTLIVVVTDHVGEMAEERHDGITYSTNKAIIERHCKLSQILRDMKGLGISYIDVGQFNRNIDNPVRQARPEGVTPTMEDVMYSSVPAQKADGMVALFYPFRHRLKKHRGALMQDFITPSKQICIHRTVEVVKNTFGDADLGLHTIFIPEIGSFIHLDKGYTGKDISDLLKKIDFQQKFFL